MHGLIFSSFRDYLSVRHRPETLKEVMDGEPIYVLSETYPDERLTALIERAASLSGMDADKLTYDFGAFTAESTFAGLYPALFAMSPTTRSFLLTVEPQIHEVVRAAIPSARPPKLSVAESDLGGVSIVYTSPRRLCSFLRGLVDGTARHYGETILIDERTCMRRGNATCTFEVRFNVGVNLTKKRSVTPAGSGGARLVGGLLRGEERGEL
jgi:hypothetical protein